MVGIAIIAAHALECLPCLYCSTCVWWHCAQVSGVGIFTFDTSLADWCRSPWQATQVTSIWLCLLSFQSETMLGVCLLWHSMQDAAGLADWANRGTLIATHKTDKKRKRRMNPPDREPARLVRAGEEGDDFCHSSGSCRGKGNPGGITKTPPSPA